MSIVSVFGRVSRSGLPRVRAAVTSYLFHSLMLRLYSLAELGKSDIIGERMGSEKCRGRPISE